MNNQLPAETDNKPTLIKRCPSTYYDSISMQFKNIQNQSMVTEVRMVVTSGVNDWEGVQRKLLGCFSQSDQGGVYTDLYLCKNSSSCVLQIIILYATHITAQFKGDVQGL